jgi:hypothetical protein
MQPFQQTDAVAVAHHHIGQHQIKMLPVDAFHGFGNAGGLNGLVALAIQGRPKHCAHVKFIIDDENPCR